METAHLEQLAREADPGEQAVPCPACGGRTFDILLTPREVEAEHRWLRRFYRWRVRGDADDLEDRAEFTQAQPTHIVRCVGCGTVLRDPRPTPETLRALYARDTYGPEALAALSKNQEAFFREKAGQVRRYVTAGARVLEIGPFVGGFLKAARDIGWRATGLDVGAETVSFMREAGLDVVQGEVSDVDLPEGAWDAVFIWNTFDQLSDPAGALDRSYDLLKRSGALVLRVPNGDFETAAIRLRERWRGTRRVEQVLRAQAYNNFLTFPYLAGYTPEALRGLLARHGFRVETISGDTILPLADGDTLPCAVREEARYKQAVRRAARAMERATGRLIAPWMDVVAFRSP